MKSLRNAYSVLAVGLLLSSCGPSLPPTLSVLYYGDESTQLDRPIIEGLRDLAKREGVDLQLEVASGERYSVLLQSRMDENRLPDLAYYMPFGRGSIGKNETGLTNLSSSVVLKDQVVTLNPAALEKRLRTSERLITIPLSMSLGHVFFANTDVLSACGLQPAKTYQELKEQTAVLQAKGFKAVLMGNREGFSLTTSLFPMVLSRLASSEYIDDLKTGSSSVEAPEFLRALEMVGTIFEDGVIDRSSFNVPYAMLQEEFLKGTAAYMIDGDWRVPSLLIEAKRGNNAPSLTGITLTTFPTLPGERESSPSTTGTVSGGYGLSATVNLGSQAGRVAVMALDLFSGRDTQGTFLTSEYLYPTWSDVRPDGTDPLVDKVLALHREVSVGPQLEMLLPPQAITALMSAVRDVALGTKEPTEVAYAVEAARHKE